jgi:hypothetical protein
LYEQGDVIRQLHRVHAVLLHEWIHVVEVLLFGQVPVSLQTLDRIEHFDELHICQHQITPFLLSGMSIVRAQSFFVKLPVWPMLIRMDERRISFPIGVRQERSAEEEEVEPLHAEFEIRNIPDTPTAFGAMIRRREIELKDVKNITSAEDLSEEALFVDELSGVLKAFNIDYFERHPEIKVKYPITINSLGILLTDGAQGAEFTPAYIRELHTYLQNYYHLPRAEEFELIGPYGGEEAESASAEAREKLLTGLRRSWQHLYRAALRREYEESMPARYTGLVRDVVWEEDTSQEQALAKRMARMNKAQFSVMFRTILTEIAGSHKKEGKASPALLAEHTELLATLMAEQSGFWGVRVPQ